jgi:uncharacterized protein
VKESRRFIADAMLGKLAKWLRILGFDVAYEHRIGDQDLVRRATSEHRHILTRDRRLVQRRWSGAVRFTVIRDDHWPEQLRQLIQELKPPLPVRLLTRCVRCNERLRPLPWKKAVDSVPPYVHRTQKRFMHCPLCGRIYWRGTHPKRIINRLRSLRIREGSNRTNIGGEP